MQTTYFANKIMDDLFGLVTYAPPSSYYLAVSKTAINVDGSGITEPSVGSYARVEMENDKTTFSNASNGSVTNDVQFKFPEATLDWGVVTHFAIFDAATGGNMLLYGELVAPRTIESSTTLVLEPGSMILTQTNCSI